MKRLNCHILFTILICVFMGITSLFSQEQRPAERSAAPSQPQQDVLYLTPEQETDVLQYLDEYYPNNIERLSRIEETNPDTYREQLSR